MKNQFLVDLGKRISYYRTNIGMSQAKLAEMANISDVYLSYIECGRKNPSAEVLCRIAEALQVSLDALLLPDIHHAKNEIDAELCRITQSYTPRQKNKIAAILQDVNALVDAVKQEI